MNKKIFQVKIKPQYICTNCFPDNKWKGNVYIPFKRRCRFCLRYVACDRIFKFPYNINCCHCYNIINLYGDRRQFKKDIINIRRQVIRNAFVWFAGKMPIIDNIRSFIWKKPSK